MLTRRDLGATVLTGLAVLVLAAHQAGWGVWLIGSSHRWAAVAVIVLGLVACSLGSADYESGISGITLTLVLLGVAAMLDATVAIGTGSSAALALLVVLVVALWAGATVRHLYRAAHHVGRRRLVT